MNALETLVAGFCRGLPRGGGRVVSVLSPFYRKSLPRRVAVGDLSIAVHPQATFERLMLYRVYERRLIRFATGLLRPGDRVVDAGAHIGWLSIHFLSAVTRTGAVHSFEPAPEFSRRLEEAAAEARQGGYQWTVTGSALGERRGTASLTLGNELNPCFNTLIEGFSRDGLRKGVVSVPLLPLDEYLEEHQVGRVRLLKIDTEGAEGMVLRGAVRALQARRIEHLIVEMSPQAEQVAGRERGESIRYLQSLGYRGQILEQGRLKPLPDHFDFWVADTYWQAPD